MLSIDIIRTQVRVQLAKSILHGLLEKKVTHGWTQAKVDKTFKNRVERATCIKYAEQFSDDEEDDVEVDEGKNDIVGLFYEHLASKGTLEIDVEERRSLVSGRPQTGKRNEILGFTGKCLEMGKNVIIFTDNFNSQKGLVEVELVRQLGRFNDGNVEKIEDNVIVRKLNDKDTAKSLFKLFVDDDKPKIIVCIVHMVPLRKISGLVKLCGEVGIKFGVCFDEADVATIKETSRSNPAKRTQETQAIVKSANVNTLFITATCAAFISARQDFDIEGKNVHQLAVRDDFMVNDKEGYNIYTFEEMFEEYCSTLLDTEQIKYIVDECASVHTFKGGEMTGVLITTEKGKSIMNHNDIADTMISIYPNSYVVVVNDGKNKIYYPEDMGMVSIETSSPLNVCLKKDVEDVWMNRVTSGNGDIETENRKVFVIGGKMLGRSVAPRAEQDIAPTSCYDMMLCTNHVYMVDAKYADSVEQGGCRLNGWYPVNVEHPERPEINVFTTAKVKTQLLGYPKMIDDQFLSFKKTENHDVPIGEAAVPIMYGCDQMAMASKTKITKSVYRSSVLGQAFLNKVSLDVFEEKVSVDPEVVGGVPAEGTLAQKIYNILKEEGDWMTGRAVYASKKDWGLNQKNPENSIYAALKQLFKNGNVCRNQNSHGINVYKTK